MPVIIPQNKRRAAKRRFLRASSLGALFFFLVAALPLGPRTPSSCLAFSVGEEREVGERLLSLIRKEFTLLDDPDLTGYISGLGSDILARAGMQFFDYRFFVIKDKELNAFAAPSGLIFVHSGLIEAMSDENELVGVLAHEIGHVASRHIARRMEKDTKVGLGTMALVLAGAMLGAGPLSEALITGSVAAGASLNLKFSREDEAEADHHALSWMQAQGRSPQGMLDLMRKLRQARMMTAGSKVPPYLLTHPAPEARMSYVQDWLAAHPDLIFKEVDEFAFIRCKYRVLAQTREPAQLIAHFSRQIAASATSPFVKAMASFGLSQAYLAGANYDKAETALREVMTRFPEKSILKTDLGVLYFSAGRLQDAEAALQEALAADRDDSYASYFLARTLEKTGDTRRALSLFESLLPVLPAYSKLYYDLGDVHSRLGHEGAASYYLGEYNWLIGEARNAKYHLKRAVKELPQEDSLGKLARERLARIEELSE